MAIAGITKNIKVAEGVSVATPSVGVGATSGSLVTFADDAAYVTAKGSAAAEGDIYQNTTDNTIHYYNGSAWVDVVDESATQTMTNKTIDADNNTISNLAHGAEVDDPSSGVHGVTGSVVGTTDTQTTTNKTLSDGTSYDFSDVAIAANTFAKPAKTVARITSGTGPLNTISGGSDGEILVIENKTGATFSIANASASGGFLTGTGNNIDLADDASVTLIYNSSDTYWSVIGGSGGAGGGLSTEIKTSDFTASKDKHYLCDTTAGAITVTLPAVADASVIRFSDLDKNFGTNNLIFAPDGSDTIDEKTSYTLRDDSAWIQIAGDAASSNWIADKSVIAGNGAIVSEWEDFTPQFSNITEGNGTLTGKFRQVGENMEVIAGLVFGTTTSIIGNMGLLIPDGKTIDNSAMSALSYHQLGRVDAFQSGTNWYFGEALWRPALGTTTIGFFNIVGSTNHSSNPMTSTVPFTWGNLDEINVSFNIPIAEWQGSGTTNTQTQVEYAYNSGTNIAGDTTSFAYGTEGATVLAFAPTTTGSVEMRVEFSEDVKPTDAVILQFTEKGEDRWVNAGDFWTGYHVVAGPTYYGAIVRPVDDQPKQFDVSFHYRAGVSTTWSAAAGIGVKWRVVKHTNAALVGVEGATVDKEGLIKKAHVISATRSVDISLTTTVNVPFDQISGGTLSTGGILVPETGKYRVSYTTKHSSGTPTGTNNYFIIRVDGVNSDPFSLDVIDPVNHALTNASYKHSVVLDLVIGEVVHLYPVFASTLNVAVGTALQMEILR